jgi:8-oxo-dGTP pyrophosphatase MutT (NUDIX family)
MRCNSLQFNRFGTFRLKSVPITSTHCHSLHEGRIFSKPVGGSDTSGLPPLRGRVGPHAALRTLSGYGCGIDTRFDIRTVIRNDVLNRVAVDERERRSCLAFIEHLDVLHRPFSETANPVHVTGSAIVVGERGVVLHLHKRMQKWLQPGGHIESGELPWDGALREAFEETGLVVAYPPNGPELVHVDVHPGPQGHTHLDLRYLLFASNVDPTPPPGESPDARWFSWREAIEIADDGLIGALRAVRGRFEDSR